jgi:hypothetical protein
VFQRCGNTVEPNYFVLFHERKFISQETAFKPSIPTHVVVIGP